MNKIIRLFCLSLFFGVLATSLSAEEVDLHDLNAQNLEQSLLHGRNIIGEDDMESFFDPHIPIEAFFEKVKFLGSSCSEVHLAIDSNGNKYALKEYLWGVTGSSSWSLTYPSSGSLSSWPSSYSSWSSFFSSDSSSWSSSWDSSSFWSSYWSSYWGSTSWDSCDSDAVYNFNLHQYFIKVALEEFEIGMLLDHPNIMKIHHLVFKSIGGGGAVYPSLILEYVEGKTVGNVRSLSESDMWVVLDEMLDASLYVLSNHILLDDLHSGNAMITNDNHFKLIDLGLYEPFQPEKLNRGDFEYYVSQVFNMAQKIVSKVKVKNDVVADYSDFLEQQREDLIWSLGEDQELNLERLIQSIEKLRAGVPLGNLAAAA